LIIILISKFLLSCAINNERKKWAMGFHKWHTKLLILPEIKILILYFYCKKKRKKNLYMLYLNSWNDIYIRIKKKEPSKCCLIIIWYHSIDLRKIVFVVLRYLTFFCAYVFAETYFMVWQGKIMDPITNCMGAIQVRISCYLERRKRIEGARSTTRWRKPKVSRYINIRRAKKLWIHRPPSRRATAEVFFTFTAVSAGRYSR